MDTYVPGLLGPLGYVFSIHSESRGRPPSGAPRCWRAATGARRVIARRHPGALCVEISVSQRLILPPAHDCNVMSLRLPVRDGVTSRCATQPSTARSHSLSLVQFCLTQQLHQRTSLTVYRWRHYSERSTRTMMLRDTNRLPSFDLELTAQQDNPASDASVCDADGFDRSPASTRTSTMTTAMTQDFIANSARWLDARNSKPDGSSTLDPPPPLLPTHQLRRLSPPLVRCSASSRKRPTA